MDEIENDEIDFLLKKTMNNKRFPPLMTNTCKFKLIIFN
jgi:hypothetical protein